MKSQYLYRAAGIHPFDLVTNIIILYHNRSFFIELGNTNVNIYLENAKISKS